MTVQLSIKQTNPSPPPPRLFLPPFYSDSEVTGGIALLVLCSVVRNVVWYIDFVCNLQEGPLDLVTISNGDDGGADYLDI